jgi:TonB family protein
MKFCPVCKDRYDEEILRFCTKDGTPLVEEEQPNFTALPSESDLGEETIVRRKTPPPIPSTAQPVPDFDDEPERVSAPRIVIPMAGESEFVEPRREPVRPATTESIRRQPPQKSNTAKVVFLTIFGTIVTLAAAAGIFWFLSNQDSNSNQNVNYNTNFNSIDININVNPEVSNSLANFNYNVNTNGNVNANANANLKTPTPTRTPTPSPSPTANANSAINMDTNALPTNIRPTPPRPSPSESPIEPPSAPPTPAPVNRPVNAGILNSRAVTLPKPAYPPLAKQMRAAGQVAVQVLVDEAGNVTSAKATSGNPLLRASAEAAARQSKFNPVLVNNQPVQASGVVLYNFIN